MTTSSKKNRSKKRQKGGQIAPQPASVPEEYDIIIIAGQSNAIGRGVRNHDPKDSMDKKDVSSPYTIASPRSTTSPNGDNTDFLYDDLIEDNVCSTLFE